MEQPSSPSSPPSPYSKRSLFLLFEIDTTPRLLLVVVPTPNRSTIAYWRRADAFLGGIFPARVGVA